VRCYARVDVASLSPGLLCAHIVGLSLLMVASLQWDVAISLMLSLPLDVLDEWSREGGEER
jgi:hypothetical protein